MADGFELLTSATVEATVTHNPPCVPECTVCYPPGAPEGD